MVEEEASDQEDIEDEEDAQSISSNASSQEENSDDPDRIDPEFLKKWKYSLISYLQEIREALPFGQQDW